MELITADLRVPAKTRIDTIYSRVDELFVGDWRANIDELASCMVAFRAQYRALRDLLRQHTSVLTEPALQGAQSFLLRSTPRYDMRVNLWFPESNLAKTNDRYRRYLSINELHNHDFSFLSICLSGPGYTSSFYTDLAFSPERRVGERLNLAFAGQIALSGDTVLRVDCELDYHAQHWPVAFSTTLNLIPREARDRPTQYVVDRESFTVREVIRAEPQLMQAAF